MEECLFCGYARTGKDVLYESDNFFVKNPKAVFSSGHVMIVPKRHIITYGTLPYELRGEFWDFYRKVSGFVAGEFSEPRVYEHGAALQTVKHMHIHIIPSATPFGPIPPLEELAGVPPSARAKVWDFSVFEAIPDYMGIVFRGDSALVYSEGQDFRSLISDALGIRAVGWWKMSDDEKSLDERLRAETERRFRI